MLPAAGPTSSGNGMGMPGQAQGKGQTQGQSLGKTAGQSQENIDTNLLSYLTDNNTGEKYLFATTNAGTAEAYIIKTGKAVMAMGGFSGSDPILSVDKLKQMVANKEVKYFLSSAGGPGGGSSEVQAWIIQNGKVVPQTAWQSSTGNSSGGMNASQTLYEINP